MTLSFNEKLRNYAKLAVRVGLGVKPGQRVLVLDRSRTIGESAKPALDVLNSGLVNKTDAAKYPDEAMKLYGALLEGRGQDLPVSETM